MASLRSVFSHKAFSPIGPYSQAIKANGFVFVSGQMPATFENNRINLTQGSVAEKTHSMCRNISTVLEAAGSNMEKVVKATVFLTDLNDLTEMNQVYAQYFPQRPARSAIEAKRLPAGASMEMELIALE